MQRFLIPVITLSLISWSICIYMLFFTPPQNDPWVFLFLTILFVSLEMTSGLVIHLARCRFCPTWQNRREILHESLALALPPSLTIPLFLLLRYITLDSLFNIGILLLLAVSFEVYIIRKI